MAVLLSDCCGDDSISIHSACGTFRSSTVANDHPSSSEAKLSWKNSSKVAELIMIERRTGKDSTFGKTLQKESINISTYVDKGLKPGTSYAYRLVVLKLPFNASDYTQAVSVVTP